MLQGIAVAEVKVIDLERLREPIRPPVLVVARRFPDLPAIRHASLAKVRVAPAHGA